MRFMGGLACLSVGTDCFFKATGAQEQHLFGQDYVWLWYPAAAMWALHMILFWFRGAE